MSPRGYVLAGLGEAGAARPELKGLAVGPVHGALLRMERDCDPAELLQRWPLPLDQPVPHDLRAGNENARDAAMTRVRRQLAALLHYSRCAVADVHPRGGTA